jgi:hypothetical protein
LKFCIQNQVNFEKEPLNSNLSKSKLEFVSFVRKNFAIKKAPFCEGATLKITGAKIKLISDREQLEILEHALRGGICNRGEVAELQVGKDGINSIAYLDMTNLYGAAMMQSLPYELLPGFYEVTMDQIMLYILKWG